MPVLRRPQKAFKTLVDNAKAVKCELQLISYLSGKTHFKFAAAVTWTKMKESAKEIETRWSANEKILDVMEQRACLKFK